MQDSLIRLNILNSWILDEIKHYSLKYQKGDGFTIPYYGLYDDAHLDKWPYENFDYTFNRYGFRDDPFPKEVDIGAFGCSVTFGQSLPKDRIWHSLLGKNTGKTVCNFGVPGKGIETIVSIFCIASKHIKMKKAVFLLPPTTRIQIATPSGEITRFDDCTIHTDSELSQNIFKALPQEEFTRIAKNQIYLAEYVAKERGIDIYFGSWHSEICTLLSKMRFNHATVLPYWTAIPNDPKEDLARDRSHPGPLHHLFWCNKILPYFQ